MTYSKGERSLLPPKQSDAKVGEGVQYRRCKPNVEPWRPGGRRPGHPRHRTVRHHRRPAEDRPHLAPWRPAIGIAPKLTDAELVTLAVMQALLGFTSEARWLRHASRHLRHLFPYLPGQSGYNKRLRAAAGLLQRAIRVLASDTTWWTDDVWVGDSTPVEGGRSTQTAHRSELA